MNLSKNTMSFQFPADLIHKVQIALRNEAGSLHHRLDPVLPSETMLVADYNHSSADLRCEHCKGRLLNGLQSLICGFCGMFVNGDDTHEPISFESTSGSKFLLGSLGLNGSEMIGEVVKGRDYNRKSHTPRKRIPLSKLLDLQIKWPDRSLEPETTTNNNAEQRTTSSTIHAELDLGEFFSRLKKDQTHVSNDERLVKGNRIESTESKNVSNDNDNLTLCHNLQPSETVVRSSSGVNFQLDPKPKGDFDEWDAFTSSISEDQSRNNRKDLSSNRKESSNTLSTLRM